MTTGRSQGRKVRALFQCESRVPQDLLGRDELGVTEGGAKAPAQRTERKIRVPGHRGEHEVPENRSSVPIWKVGCGESPERAVHRHQFRKSRDSLATQEPGVASILIPFPGRMFIMGSRLQAGGVMRVGFAFLRWRL